MQAAEQTEDIVTSYRKLKFPDAASGLLAPDQQACKYDNAQNKNRYADTQGLVVHYCKPFRFVWLGGSSSQ